MARRVNQQAGGVPVPVGVVATKITPGGAPVPGVQPIVGGSNPHIGVGGAPPQILGGADGAPIQGAATHISTPGQVTRSSIREDRVDADGEIPIVKRYRVMQARQVLYNGIQVPMREGKEFTEYEYDVQLLQRQGLRLQEITAE
jgi:hypothetical protein